MRSSVEILNSLNWKTSKVRFGNTKTIDINLYEKETLKYYGTISYVENSELCYFTCLRHCVIPTEYMPIIYELMTTYQEEFKNGIGCDL